MHVGARMQGGGREKVASASCLRTPNHNVFFRMTGVQGGTPHVDRCVISRFPLTDQGVVAPSSGVQDWKDLHATFVTPLPFPEEACTCSKAAEVACERLSLPSESNRSRGCQAAQVPLHHQSAVDAGDGRHLERRRRVFNRAGVAQAGRSQRERGKRLRRVEHLKERAGVRLVRLSRGACCGAGCRTTYKRTSAWMWMGGAFAVPSSACTHWP
eukprot:361532-Chlamydomonas_euryale.AAC.3